MYNALILFSGGLDSTVMLAKARAENKHCLALSFDYNQKHRVELTHAKELAAHYNTPHQILSVTLQTSALTDPNIPVPKELPTSIPSTHVPARNTLFIAYALGIAEIHHIPEIHFGPNALDHDAYPDCRPTFVTAMQNLLNVASTHPPKLITPLLHLDKKQIATLARTLNVPIEKTFSCYDPQNLRPCGSCLACRLRTEALAQ